MALYALYNVPACRHARAIRSTHGSTRCVPRLSVQRQALQDKQEASSPSSEMGSDGAEQQQQQQRQQQVETSTSLATTAARVAAEVVASPIFYLFAGLATVKLITSTGEQTAGILLAAAAPVTLLTALSKSDVGRRVQERLEERLPLLRAEADALRAAHAAARGRSRWYGDARPRLPAALFGSAPHLQGEVAGDYGFDPLGLAAEPARFAKYHEAELLHGRWAMLAAIGCLVPEALSMAGVELGEPVWWKVGAAKLQGDLTLNWGGIEGFRIAGKQGIGVIAACQVVLMGGPEYARAVGIRSLEPVGVFLPGDQNYPGGAPFDPLRLSERPDEFVDQAVKEIKHGRLAMIAMAGYAAQAIVTRDGPLANLAKGLATFAPGAM